jgi:hypothetical protein
MKLSDKARRYLKMIGQTDDSSLVLTHGFAKQAGELQRNGLAEYIPISSGGCYVALTTSGVLEYQRLNPQPK